MQAGGGAECRICLSHLSRLTSTSTRHLSRLIKELESTNLIQISRRPGRCNIYHLPANYVLISNQLLTADWSQKKDPPPSTTRDDWHNQTLIYAWQSAFSLRYQPVSPEEQTAMDYMLFAHNNNRLGDIKAPVAYLKTIIKNGHPLDFPSFIDRKESMDKQEVAKDKKHEEEQKIINYAWSKYNNIPKSQQKILKKKFKTQFLKQQPRQIADIFNKKGFKHPAINGLFGSYLISELGV